MTWFTVLKMPNPHGGQWADLTRDQYYEMDDRDKRMYHGAIASRIQKKLKRAVTPRIAGQAPATDDQIREMREEHRFHNRQKERLIDKSKTKIYPRGEDKRDFYSIEDEDDRQKSRPIKDAVDLIPSTTKEMYDNYSREEKIKYWSRIKQLDSRKIRGRMTNNPDYNPPFEPDVSTLHEYKDAYRHRDISEYDDFTDEEKYKYHIRMSRRFRANDEKRVFYGRMGARLRNKSLLPTYPTPEAEKEAEQ